MRLSVCITTINAVDVLNSCLQALWQSTIKPSYVVVSDDSLAPEIQQQNRHVVAQYLHTEYVVGPHKGVCANRNYALKHLPSSDYIAFIDDDICVAPDYIANALSRYRTLNLEARQRTFLTGGIPTKLSFRGFFSPSDRPLCVDLHTAVFPADFFQTERWDEKIFFGYEDALLCLQAIKQGYSILHCPELNVVDTRSGQSTLKKNGLGQITKYEIYVEAARLYVGIKRYKSIFPNPFKLTIFLSIYFMHMNIYLLRKKAISAWSEIIKYSHFKDLFIGNILNVLLDKY
jgi:glycosyltransferase involved in cell wall biosynthesis